MSIARRRDTAPELALRRQLHALGLRYRVTYPVPGQRRRTIDVAFTRVRLAIFVDGCFWHGCPEHGTRPRSNSAWWQQKLAANTARDRDTDRVLIEAGWTVLRFWEHTDPTEVARVVLRTLEDLRDRS
ncbi:very short patch repair endonuclease [Sanguibacter hominis ATCC BAA-789]|uniref:Very short patch repair endonuclease n=1 Tax=Sanguibacter hominis ATCC BAA-789 TaxID=1312740 RepID=A0A9X5IRE0_9MICO|nr:very short patch repair endonuclease [Sanguibacter hominis]NKX92688.1 very short patch repair endonuclease [Sanguibacter hominis ATCC BAA-789]